LRRSEGRSQEAGGMRMPIEDDDEGLERRRREMTDSVDITGADSLNLTMFRSLVVVASTFVLAGLLPKTEGAETKPLRGLIITGGCCHDYSNQKNIIAEGVS